MKEIIAAWKALEDTVAEHELFDAYVRARDAYLSSIKSRVKGISSAEEVGKLCEAELAAFAAYLSQRRKAKPE